MQKQSNAALLHHLDWTLALSAALSISEVYMIGSSALSRAGLITETTASSPFCSDMELTRVGLSSRRSLRMESGNADTVPSTTSSANSMPCSAIVSYMRVTLARHVWSYARSPKMSTMSRNAGRPEPPGRNGAVTPCAPMSFTSAPLSTSRLTKCVHDATYSANASIGRPKARPSRTTPAPCTRNFSDPSMAMRSSWSFTATFSKRSRTLWAYAGMRSHSDFSRISGLVRSVGAISSSITSSRYDRILEWRHASWTCVSPARMAG
mmetsp:Transcript_3050/g.13742  ORF Transcript_3050/g.13742 Transcript_3050/m.13742 type:complete len:265 (+) Transcript_3050:973-1767(+)